MANTYTWSIDDMDTQKQLDSYTNVVIEVGWSCTGRNGEIFSTIPGRTRLTFVGDGNFTPYKELTQDTVLNWLWGHGVSQSSVELIVDQLIKEQITPTILNMPLPWSV